MADTQYHQQGVTMRWLGLALPLVFVLGVSRAADDTPAPGTAKSADVAGAVHRPRADAAADINSPRADARHVSFEATEGTWMSVDVSPDGQTLVFDLLGDIY